MLIRHKKTMTGFSRSAANGFTLLEVMVVLFIIGLLVGLSNLNFTENQLQNDTRRFANRLALLMNMYREEAVYRNLDLGLAIDVSDMLLLSYQSLDQQEVVADKEREDIDDLAKNPWQSYSNSVFSSPEVPDGVTFTLLVEGEEVDFDEFLGDDDAGPKPALMFFSAEDYSPFELVVQHDADSSFEIRLHGDGFNPVWHEMIQYDE